MPLTERLFIWLQHALPHHLLSRFVGSLARTEAGWVRRPFIRWFGRTYGVDLSEAAEEEADAYRSFNDYFTRALKPGARPIDPDPGRIVCPADGALSQCGTIRSGRLLQAKGIDYSLCELTGIASENAYEGGRFATVYLAPHNYHRVHMPLAGRLTRTTAIPGALFSVNAVTARGVRNLFARNERLVCHFDTEAGELLLVFVGALIVASIETVWDGPQSPYRARESTRFEQPIEFAKGAEIGRFLLGSTVILCFPPGAVQWSDTLVPDAILRMGESIGSLTA